MNHFLPASEPVDDVEVFLFELELGDLESALAPDGAVVVEFELVSAGLGVINDVIGWFVNILGAGSGLFMSSPFSLLHSSSRSFSFFFSLKPPNK